VTTASKLESIPVGSPLPPAEMRVMRLIAEGEGRKHVAAALGYSVATVSTYIERSYRRLGAFNAAHAVNRLYQTGALVAPTPERETP
jgi:DNA-binding CsgD family transcriptional regulator